MSVNICRPSLCVIMLDVVGWRHARNTHENCVYSSTILVEETCRNWNQGHNGNLS